ncbi:hypothetical protein ACFL52_04490 [Candidatus Margulisiibacteriota bacterium]
MSINIIQKIIFVILLIIFAFSLFKHISYPLLWNDEAETAAYGERILKYGYPKVHSENNRIFLLFDRISINKQLDAFIGSGWVQYYFCAIPAFFARLTDDLYLKTALIRFPFALIGFCGILLFGLAGATLQKKITPLLFLSAFIFLEALSVPLVHHLREARYYSIYIFLAACWFYVYTKYNYKKELGYVQYLFLSIILLLLIFNTFYPIFFIILATMLADNLFRFVTKNIKRQEFLAGLAAPIITFILAIPFIYFFRVFTIAKFHSTAFGIGFDKQIKQIGILLIFLLKHNFLILIIASAFLFIFLSVKDKNKLREPVAKPYQIFTLILISIYCLSITRSPFFFERYYIVLQPFLMLSLLFWLLSLKDLKQSAAIVIIVIFIYNSTFLISPIRGHTYEMFNQYQGPLDYIIPYLSKNFKYPEKLIIATNYEEAAYIYYLKSKTIIGAGLCFIDQDIKLTPDIIVFRKRWSGHASVFKTLFAKVKYQKVSFPVLDYTFNNIPESTLHLYQTFLPRSEPEVTDIYIRKGLIDAK